MLICMPPSAPSYAVRTVEEVAHGVRIVEYLLLLEEAAQLYRRILRTV